jgi:hypothetical protein
MKKLLNQAATHTHMGTRTARFIAEAERDHIYGQTKRKNQNSTLKMQKLIFSINDPNRITTNPQRSLLSLPHLIIGIKFDFLAHS